MTTKPIKGYRLDAKGKLVKRPPRMAAHERKRIEGKAKSLEKRWKGKGK
jgi:hypothetical protein